MAIKVNARETELKIGKNPGYYYVMTPELYTALKIFLMDKNNSYVTIDTLEGGIPVMRFDGMKVVRLDCMINTESQFT